MPPASTIMIATSPSSSLRPATTISKVDSSPSWYVGWAIHSPSMVRDAHRADRAVERDARDHERRGRAVDRRDVVRVLEVGAEDGGDDLDLVAEVARERRAQRTVGEPAGQDRLLARPTFTAEERAGDLARGVHPLLDVDRQREEVDALAGLATCDGGQQRGVTDAGRGPRRRPGWRAGRSRTTWSSPAALMGPDRRESASSLMSGLLSCVQEQSDVGGSQLSASGGTAPAGHSRLTTDGVALLDRIRETRSGRSAPRKTSRYRRRPSLAMRARYRSTSLRRR